MKPNSSFILIISLLLSIQLSGQTVSEVVKFADQQFEKSNFTIASKEYNRAFFFGYEPKDIISLQIAHCYQQQSEYVLAAEFYDRAYRLSSTDSIKVEAILGKSFCLLLQEKYVLAISELLNIPDKTTLNQQIQYHFLKGIGHFGMKDDTASFIEFNEAMKLSCKNENEKFALQNEFDKVNHYQKRYNPKRAYVMSGIVPGSGQLSVGAFKDGINSMLLVGGLYFISIKVIGLYSFMDAVIALFPWIQRYYMGGMDKAKGLAFSKIEEKRYQSYLKIMEIATPPNYK